MLAEGSRIPDFDLEDAQGGRLRAADLAGRPCAVYFYPKDFTPGCTTETAEFAAEAAGFRAAGVRVVGISPDDAETHRRFLASTGAGHSLLADTEKRAARAFGVWGKKKFMGREYMGVLRSTFLAGPDGVVFRAFSGVRPRGHAKEVLGCFSGPRPGARAG